MTTDGTEEERLKSRKNIPARTRARSYPKSRLTRKMTTECFRRDLTGNLLYEERQPGTDTVGQEEKKVSNSPVPG